MFKVPKRLVATVSAAVLGIGLITASSPAAAADPISIGQTQIGNIFTDSTPSFTINTPAASSWTVIDDQGREAAHGTLPPGQVTLEVPHLELGQYTLNLTDGTTSDNASTTFALIAPWTGAKDPKFGLNTGFGLPSAGGAPVWNADTKTFTGGVPVDNLDLAPILNATGAGGIRDTLGWNQFEPEKGLYAGGPAYFDGLVNTATGMGTTPLIILSYGNSLYDQDAAGKGAAPYTQEGIQAYANYAKAVLDRYPGKVSAVEVWNEYNGAAAPWNRGPCRADAHCYYEMLKATAEVVHETHPEAKIVGPAGVTIPYAWLEQLFSYGALDYLDAVTVHPYGFPASPEAGYSAPNLPGVGLDSRVAQLDTLIRQYNNGAPKPIWFTEIGWGSYHAARGVSEVTQADYLVRSNVIAFASGVDRVYWFQLKNSKSNPVGPGANWGLVRNTDDPLGKYTPKEAFSAYATMTRTLSGAQFTARDATPAGVRSYEFVRPDGQQVRAMWSPDGPQDVTLSTPSQVVATREDGQNRTLQPYEDQVHLSLGSSPIYVTGTVDSITAGSLVSLSAPQSAAAGSDVTVTATVDGSDQHRATPAFVTIEGSRLHVVTPPRQTRHADTTVNAGQGVETTPLEGQAQQRTRTILAEVRIASKLAGWLSVQVAVN